MATPCSLIGMEMMLDPTIRAFAKTSYPSDNT